MLKKLFSQTAIYGLSATLAKFLNYLLTPYLTRVMTDTVYGEVSYLYSIIPFANVVLTLGFATGYFRFVSQCETLGEQKRLFTTLWSQVSLLALVSCGVASLIFPTPEVMVMLALICVDNVAAMPNALLRQRGKVYLYTAAQLSSVVINVGLCYWFYSCWDGALGSAIWVLVANLVASFASLLILLPYSLRMLTRCVDWALLKRVAKYSLPLMVAGVMGIAAGFIDRQMIKWMLPESIAYAELGIYSAVAKLASLMVIFRQMYSLGAEPFFLQKFSKADFSRMNAIALKYFYAVGILIFLGIMLYSDLVALILGSSFRVGMDMLPILLLANLLSGILINLSFWYKVVDKTSVAITVTLVGVVVTVCLNLWLIDLWGASGAAWGRALGALSMVVVSYLFSLKYYPVKYDSKALLLYTILGASIYIISLYTADIPHNLLRWAINGFMILLFCIIFVRKEKLLSRLKK